VTGLASLIIELALPRDSHDHGHVFPKSSPTEPVITNTIPLFSSTSLLLVPGSCFPSLFASYTISITVLNS